MHASRRRRCFAIASPAGANDQAAGGGEEHESWMTFHTLWRGLIMPSSVITIPCVTFYKLTTKWFYF